MANYIELLSNNHRDKPATCNGDPTVYTDIEFIDGSVDKATLDAEWLDLCKTKKKSEIDDRTRELIVSGISYGGVLFSSSETAQRNWMALDQFKAYHTYPVAVTAADDSEHTFADQTEVSTFVLTCMGTISAHYASGRALKISIDAATDEAGVDAVVDNR